MNFCHHLGMFENKKGKKVEEGEEEEKEDGREKEEEKIYGKGGKR